jgi:hypothetical protein
MTRQITLSLDLNENDLDALKAVLDNPEAVARAIAPQDSREQIRIIDVLAEMAAGLLDAMADTLEASQQSDPHQRRGRSM